MWPPISQSDLERLIEAEVVQMEPHERRLWELICIPPTKWQQHPWGDDGNGFWVVGVMGQRAIWYNDIEEGFNVSRFSEAGTLDEYLCNQSELHDVVRYLHNGVRDARECWWFRAMDV